MMILPQVQVNVDRGGGKGDEGRSGVAGDGTVTAEGSQHLKGAMATLGPIT
jgi:hypothetical protein